MGGQPLSNEIFGRALAAAILAGGIVLTSLAGAAERDPVLEMAQAQCIQEGMLRGLVGEALKSYVNTCAAIKRNAPPRELKPFAADPAAC